MKNSQREPLRSSPEENARFFRGHNLARLIACLLSWPAAVAAGWLLGDRRNVIVDKAIWDGPLRITTSPGLGMLALTVLPWALGIILMLGYPHTKFGFRLCIIAAVAGGLFSFLIGFAFNAI